MEFSFSGRGPGEMNFAATNVAETWRKWRQSMQLYINATMAKKTQEIYSFLWLARTSHYHIRKIWMFDRMFEQFGSPRAQALARQRKRARGLHTCTCLQYPHGIYIAF